MLKNCTPVIEVSLSRLWPYMQDKSALNDKKPRRLQTKMKKFSLPILTSSKTSFFSHLLGFSSPRLSACIWWLHQCHDCPSLRVGSELWAMFEWKPLFKAGEIGNLTMCNIPCEEDFANSVSNRFFLYPSSQNKLKALRLVVWAFDKMRCKQLINQSIVPAWPVQKFGLHR